MSDNSIDTNIDNYSIDELYQILHIKTPSLDNILTSTRNIINRFLKEKNSVFVRFFKEVQNRLVENFTQQNENIQNTTMQNRTFTEEEREEKGKPDDEEDDNPDENAFNDGSNELGTEQQSEWEKYQYLASSSEKTDNYKRRRGIDVFDNSHATMKQKELNIQNSYNVPLYKAFNQFTKFYRCINKY